MGRPSFSDITFLPTPVKLANPSTTRFYRYHPTNYISLELATLTAFSSRPLKLEHSRMAYDAPNIDAASLFSVPGLTAVITGGGSGTVDSFIS